MDAWASRKFICSIKLIWLKNVDNFVSKAHFRSSCIFPYGFHEQIYFITNGLYHKTIEMFAILWEYFWHRPEK